MPLESKSAYPVGVVMAVSVEQFIQFLADSGLMTADEVHGFLAGLSPDAVKRFQREVRAAVYLPELPASVPRADSACARFDRSPRGIKRQQPGDQKRP